MEFLIISGMSGAGKSRAADMLEDMDYYCVDNMPVALLPRFAELCLAVHGRYEKVALVTDIREKDGFSVLSDSLNWLKENDITYHILFIEADPRTILMRYKETRRPHPLQTPNGTMSDAINKERALLAPIREAADFIINTSGLSLSKLQTHLGKILNSGSASAVMNVNITVFGYKYGLPMDADLVFDVRFLPNPFYIEEMRELTGLDKEVSDYIFDFKDAGIFLQHLDELLTFLMPIYMEDGRFALNIAIGCTGGRHRSVAIAKALADKLSEKSFVNVSINYRDIDKG